MVCRASDGLPIFPNAEKGKRYDDRKVGRDTGPVLHKLAGNKEFINWFDEYARKEVKDGTGNKKQLEKTVHKYTRTLFTGTEHTWLEWMTEKRGNDFRLVRLIDFASDTLCVPQGPENWLNTVSNTSNYGGKR